MCVDEYYDLTDANKWDDIHVITSALKLFFRELKEPLLTYVLFPRIIDMYTKYGLSSAINQINFIQDNWVINQLHRSDITLCVSRELSVCASYYWMTIKT